MTTVGSSGSLLPNPSPITPPAAGAAAPVPVTPADAELPPETPDSAGAPPVADGAEVAVAAEANMEANQLSFDPLTAPAPLEPAPVIAPASRLAAPEAVADVTPVPELTESPIQDDAQLERLAALTAEGAGEAFAGAEEGTAMHRLGVAMGLLQTLNAEGLGPEGDQTLQQRDQEAYEVLQMRRLALEQQVQTLMTDPDVQSELGRVRDEAMTEVFGEGVDAVAERQAEYLTGTALQAEIADLPEAEQEARMALEMSRLTALDPVRAQATSLTLVDQQIRENPQAFLDTMEPDETVRALDALLQDPSWLAEAQGPASASVGALRDTADLATVLMNNSIRTGLAEGLAGVMASPEYQAATDDASRMAVMRSHVGRIEDLEVRQAANHLLTGLEGTQAVGAGLGHLSRGIAVVGAARRLVGGDLNADDRSQLWSTGLGLTHSYGVQSVNMIRRLAGREAMGLAARGGVAFARELLGPAADAVMIPVDYRGIQAEIENEDEVGAWSRRTSVAAGVAGVAAGIAGAAATTAAGSAATVVGAPVAVVAAVVAAGAGVVGLGATLTDAVYGESELTGEFRQQLRYLEISTDEEDVAHNLTTERRDVDFGRGVTRNVEVDLSPEDVRERAAAASVGDRIKLINQYVEDHTSETEENLVADIIQDTAADPDDFQLLIDNLPMGRIASELDNAEVGGVLETMVRFTQEHDVPPQDVMGEFLVSLARDHRQGALDEFLDAVPAEVFQALPAETLRVMTTHLMDGATSGAEEETIVNVLRGASPEQFSDIFRGSENASYRRRLSSELSSGQIRRAQGLPAMAPRPSRRN